MSVEPEGPKPQPTVPVRVSVWRRLTDRLSGSMDIRMIAIGIGLALIAGTWFASTICASNW